MIQVFKFPIPASPKPAANSMYTHKTKLTFQGLESDTWDSFQALQDMRGSEDHEVIQALKAKAKKAWEAYAGAGAPNTFAVLVSRALTGTFKEVELPKYLENAEYAEYPSYHPIVKGKPLKKRRYTPPETKAQQNLQRWVNDKTRTIEGRELTLKELSKLKALCIAACGKTFINELSSPQRTCITELIPQSIQTGTGINCMDEFVLKK